MKETIFRLFAKYIGCEWEEVDSFDTMEEARSMLAEYRLAYGSGFAWKVVESCQTR